MSIVSHYSCWEGLTQVFFNYGIFSVDSASLLDGLDTHLVLNDLPVVEGGGHVLVLHVQEDLLVLTVHIGVLEDTMGAGVDSQVVSQPYHQIIEHWTMACFSRK